MAIALSFIRLERSALLLYRGVVVTAYESIKNKLSATEIYDIKQGGLIDAEIRAYAVALQVAYDKVDVLLRECFVQTAESYGLEQLESMARTYMNGDTLEIRRNKLINRLQINPSIIGKDALKKQVASLGLECNITENIADSKIYVDILTEVADDKKEFLKAELLRFAPLHLIMYVTFNGVAI